MCQIESTTSSHTPSDCRECQKRIECCSADGVGVSSAACPRCSSFLSYPLRCPSIVDIPPNRLCIILHSPHRHLSHVRFLCHGHHPHGNHVFLRDHGCLERAEGNVYGTGNGCRFASRVADRASRVGSGPRDARLLHRGRSLQLLRVRSLAATQE